MLSWLSMMLLSMLVVGISDWSIVIYNGCTINLATNAKKNAFVAEFFLV